MGQWMDPVVVPGTSAGALVPRPFFREPASSSRPDVGCLGVGHGADGSASQDQLRPTSR